MNGNMAGWPGVGTEEQMIKEIEMKLKRTEAMLETFDLFEMVGLLPVLVCMHQLSSSMMHRASLPEWLRGWT